MERWLLLTDYASKYRVSVSTLRRRIKAGSQRHRFESGKYYLPDEAIVLHPGDAVPDMSHTDAAKNIAPPPTCIAQTPALPSPVNIPMNIAPSSFSAVTASPGSSAMEEPLITTTSKLLNELKQAYTLILHEKEDQIMHLREEIADLKTLVRVLESENARLSDEQARTKGLLAAHAPSTRMDV